VNIRLNLCIALIFLAVVESGAETIIIKSGNVIGDPLPGEMPHHMQLTQQDFAKLVSVNTEGQVDFRILEGKRDDIPVFRMPAMTKDGTAIQACAVPSFFLPRVDELKIFEIPYLFRDASHAARYPQSEPAKAFSALIEERYDIKVLGQLLVARTVAITSTDKPIIVPANFAGRFVNDDFESFAPMWRDIKPERRYSIGYVEAVEGALHAETELDTSIGMLQNIFVQKQYTKFRHATIAPSFYVFFYTLMINRNVWDDLDESHRTAMLAAARTVEISAFDNEKATAIYHESLNRSLGMSIHMQSPSERRAWEREFSDKVRDGILEKSNKAEELRRYIDAVRAL
jgi:TRAP-type C4-dicarboxylate transport system substrate-binding protein